MEEDRAKVCAHKPITFPDYEPRLPTHAALLVTNSHEFDYSFLFYLSLPLKNPTPHLYTKKNFMNSPCHS